MFKKRDAMLKAKPTKTDNYLIFFFGIITILFFVAYLLSSDIHGFGLEYLFLSIITLGMFFIAITSKQRATQWVLFGQAKTKRAFFNRLLVDVVIGLVFGFIIAGGYLGFSLAFNLPTATTTTNPFVILIIATLFGALAEELFVRGVFEPTTGLFFTKRTDVIAIMIVLGLISAFVGGYYIGALAIYIGIFFFAAAILMALALKNRKAERLFKKESINVHYMEIVFGTIMFILIHAYVGGLSSNPWDLYIASGLFSVTADAINWIRQSIMAGLVGHMTNNGIVVSKQLGLSIWYGVASITLAVGFLLAVGYIFGNKKNANSTEERYENRR